MTVSNWRFMPAEEPARPWLVLAGLCLGLTVTNGFARFAYGLLLPAMKAENGWSYAQSGWLNTANALGYIAGALLTAALIRRLPPGRLFAFGLVTTNIALLATGAEAAIWWQTLWRGLAGFFGAMSFSTAGALAARLWRGDARRNALAIALLFGAGGGLGVMLAGAALPAMLEIWGPGRWRFGWYAIGGLSLAMLPLGLWAAAQLRPPPGQAAPERTRLPVGRMLGVFAGYASFGLGYFVYFTFLGVWMAERDASAPLTVAVWVLLGACLCASPFVWRPVMARFASGLPLAMILTGIAAGSALPVLWPGALGLAVSAVVFGLCVFMAPGAVTHFARQNLPMAQWGAAISLFTVVFALAQTAGPFGAGLLGDLTGNIGTALLAAAGVLLAGAVAAFGQGALGKARPPGD